MAYRKIDQHDQPEAFMTRGYAYGDEQTTPILWLEKLQSELVAADQHIIAGYVGRAHFALLKLSVSGTSMQSAFGLYGKRDDSSLKELFTCKNSVKVIHSLRQNGKDDLASEFLEIMFGCREYTIHKLKKLRDNAHVSKWTDEIMSSPDDAFLKRAYSFEVSPEIYPANEKTTPYIFLEKLGLHIAESVDSQTIIKESEIFQSLTPTIDNARLALRKIIASAAGLGNAFGEFTKCDEDAILQLKKDAVYVSSVFFNAQESGRHREFSKMMREFDSAIISHLGEEVVQVSSRSLS